jgi:NADPH-dependent ferric siderophore reductase
MAQHDVTKIRLEAKRRRVTVIAVSQVTPRMRRVEFSSEDLQDFLSPSPDDHIKIFFPVDDSDTIMRDFTPRAFDQASGTLTVDFALHESGPATTWARNANPGDILEIGGPRGSSIVSDDFDWYLMVGDAAAIPSFGRRLESLRTGVPATTLIAIEDAGEQQTFVTQASWTARWIFSGSDPRTADQLQAALQDYVLPQGAGFIWIAAEASASRDLYQHLVEQRDHPAKWIKASAYWTREMDHPLR